MWVGRAGVGDPETEFALSSARDRGVKHARRLAEENAATYGLTSDECYLYFTKHLQFTLGPSQLEGLRLFYRKASQWNLAPPGREVNSYRLVVS